MGTLFSVRVTHFYGSDDNAYRLSMSQEEGCKSVYGPMKSCWNLFVCVLFIFASCNLHCGDPPSI